MSRTIKSKGGRRDFFRRPRTQQSRVVEASALSEMIENGFNPSPRLQNRANVAGCIPTAYDDLNFSTRDRGQS